MRPSGTLAIISPDFLITKGLKSVIQSLGDYKIKDFPSFPETIKDEADYYIITLEQYCIHISFFKPRTSRTLLLSSSPLPSSDEIPPHIHPRMSKDDIISTLQTLLSPQNEDESDQAILTLRETEILRELAKGKSFKEIADTLCISVSTVTTHRKNITGKLGIRSLSGLSVYAMMNGII